MKKITYLIAFTAAVLLISGCSGWLEEEARTNVSIDEVSGEAAMQALLTGAYASMRNTYTLSSNIGIVGTDICRAGKNNDNTATLDVYSLNSSQSVITNAWINSFAAIGNCNVVINRTMNDPKVSDAVKTNIIGQARFLRAFSYFKMVQWFGALPIVTDETLEYSEVLLNSPRAPISDVYELIVSDLIYASSPGVLDENIVDGTATMWAAKGMLAKVYLTMGTSKARLGYNIPLMDNFVLAQYGNLPKSPEEYYRLAYNLLYEIISSGKFSLQDSYGDNFSIEVANKFTNGESMWEIPYSTQRGYGGTWSKQFGQNISGASTYLFNAMGGQQNYTPVPSFWGYYKKGDIRRRWNISDQAIVITNNLETETPRLRTHSIPDESYGVDLVEVYRGNMGVNNDTGVPGNSGRFFASDAGAVKYRWGSGDPETMYAQVMGFSGDNCPNNVVVLRYADVLLMFIETDMLLGGATPANLSSTGASSTALRIMNEQLLWRARGGRSEQQMLQESTNTWGDYIRDEYGNPEPVPDGKESDYQMDYNNSDNPLTFGELVKQRACELCFEFHRWNDLVRWGILGEMYQARITSSVNGVVSVNNYLFPIPLRELQAAHDNEGFYKNPGY
jgi:hypothetical protein